MAKQLPKHIREKCDRIERLCEEAQALKRQVEDWCEKNGIDTFSEEWETGVKNDSAGCSATLDADVIEELLMGE